jgi:hypothetical protein
MNFPGVDHAHTTFAQLFDDLAATGKGGACVQISIDYKLRLFIFL